MPELTTTHIALLAIMVVVGAIVGWILRGNRSQHEKAAVSAGWQEQLEAQRIEHDRLTEQNKTLMEQVSQYQASNRDAKNRARELSEAVQEAYARRDELQRELKDIRTNLETAVNERDQLQSDIAENTGSEELLEQKNARIEKLESELQNWQDRLPPLIERFRVRNEEAEQLEADLDTARARIRELESMIAHGETRVEPVEDPESLTDGLDASNDTIQVESSMIEESVILAEPEADEEPESDDEDADDVTDLAEVLEPDEDFDSAIQQLDADEDADDEDQEDDQSEDDDFEEDDTEEDELSAVVETMNGSKDDLKQIKGVGPAIEKTLNELGIFRFDQIADMSEYDIDRVANRLRGFRSRIYREDWIGQARELRDGQAGA